MDETAAAYPSGFYCEYTPSKTRVHALVRHDAGPEVVTALLTLTGRESAEAVARVLNQALGAVPGPVLSGEIERVAGLLPAAVRASFTDALRHLRSGTWPAPALYGGWSESDEDDEDDEHADVPRRLADQYLRHPLEGRLADLPGPVVRLGRLLEFHVHEPARVLAAARAGGWEPDAEGDVDEEDRLLDAVMWLADAPPEVPGADALVDESVGHVLEVGEEELSDWSRVPVVFDFGPGYRLDAPASAEMPGAEADADVDYAALFPLPACTHEEDEQEPWCNECEGFIITPRNAALLSAALTIMADECRMDIERHASARVDRDELWAMFERLPLITWGQNAEWRSRFAQAATDLRRDLDAGRRPTPRSIGEEMALHFAIENAESIKEMAEDSESLGATLVRSLPEHAQDYDWDLVDESLLGESDITLLFDDAADGIEDPEDEINRRLGIGDMRPAAWFTPFANVPQRQADQE